MSLMTGFKRLLSSSDSASSGATWPWSRRPAGARRLEAAELCERLSLIERWDGKAWQDKNRLFQEVYGGPLPFLPPGMPPALLLQATLGEADRRSFPRQACRSASGSVSERFPGSRKRSQGAPRAQTLAMPNDLPGRARMWFTSRWRS